MKPRKPFRIQHKDGFSGLCHHWVTYGHKANVHLTDNWDAESKFDTAADAYEELELLTPFLKAKGIDPAMLEVIEVLDVQRNTVSMSDVERQADLQDE